MNLIASPTVWIPSDFSSGIEIPNSFSNSMMSYTVSSESAPRSCWKVASGVTSASLTPNLSTIIAFTLSEISDIMFKFKNVINIYFLLFSNKFVAK